MWVVKRAPRMLGNRKAKPGLAPDRAADDRGCFDATQKRSSLHAKWLV
jgi:hypothetical protein